LVLVANVGKETLLGKLRNDGIKDISGSSGKLTYKAYK